VASVLDRAVALFTASPHIANVGVNL
jgi:hypothetical protein